MMDDHPDLEIFNFPYCKICGFTIVGYQSSKRHYLSHARAYFQKYDSLECPLCDFQGNKLFHVHMHLALKHTTITLLPALRSEGVLDDNASPVLDGDAHPIKKVRVLMKRIPKRELDEIDDQSEDDPVNTVSEETAPNSDIPMHSCTFPDCNAKENTIDDLRRHQLNQHIYDAFRTRYLQLYQSDACKCPFCGVGTSTTGDESAFMEHLAIHHSTMNGLVPKVEQQAEQDEEIKISEEENATMDTSKDIPDNDTSESSRSMIIHDPLRVNELLISDGNHSSGNSGPVDETLVGEKTSTNEGPESKSDVDGESVERNGSNNNQDAN